MWFLKLLNYNFLNLKLTSTVIVKKKTKSGSYDSLNLCFKINSNIHANMYNEYVGLFKVNKKKCVKLEKKYFGQVNNTHSHSYLLVIVSSS